MNTERLACKEVGCSITSSEESCEMYKQRDIRHLGVWIPRMTSLDKCFDGFACVLSFATEFYKVEDRFRWKLTAARRHTSETVM